MFDALYDFPHAAPSSAARAEADGEPKSVRSLIVARSEDGRLRSLLGGDESVLVVDAGALARDWSSYVAARARSSGALVVEAEERPDLASAGVEIGRGALFERPAAARVVDETLIFALEPRRAIAARAA